MSEIKERRPQESEAAKRAFQSAIVEEMQEAVYVRGADRDLLYMNPAAERLTGWSVAEALKVPCYKVFGDSGERCHGKCPIDPVLSTGEPCRHMEGTVETRDGRTIPVEVSITRLPEAAGRAGAVVILRDISEVRALERERLKAMREFQQGVLELKKSEERFRDFASMTADWMWETDANHRFTFMGGKTPTDPRYFIGRRREDIVDTGADARRWEPYFDWIDYEKSYTDFVYPLTLPDGGHTWVSISGKPIYDEHGAFFGYRGVGHRVEGDRNKK